MLKRTDPRIHTSIATGTKARLVGIPDNCPDWMFGAHGNVVLVRESRGGTARIGITWERPTCNLQGYVEREHLALEEDWSQEIDLPCVMELEDYEMDRDDARLTA